MTTQDQLNEALQMARKHAKTIENVPVREWDNLGYAVSFAARWLAKRFTEIDDLASAAGTIPDGWKSDIGVHAVQAKYARERRLRSDAEAELSRLSENYRNEIKRANGMALKFDQARRENLKIQGQLGESERALADATDYSRQRGAILQELRQELSELKAELQQANDWKANKIANDVVWRRKAVNRDAVQDVIDKAAQDIRKLLEDK